MPSLIIIHTKKYTENLLNLRDVNECSYKSGSLLKIQAAAQERNMSGK